MIAAWPAADAHRQLDRGAEPWVRELSLLGRYPGRAPVGLGGIGQAVTVDSVDYGPLTSAEHRTIE